MAQVPGLAPRGLSVEPGSTILMVGKPGNGKSTLAEWMARGAPSAIVYETKGDPREQSRWREAGFRPVHRVTDLDLHARALLIVTPELLADADAWGAALGHPFRRTPTLLIFDEVLETFPVRSHPMARKLLHQARSWGHVLVIGSQMANDIDTRLLRLSQHVMVMGPAQNRDDLGYLERATGAPTAGLRQLEKRQIGWWSEGSDHWWLFDRIDPAVPGRLRPLVSPETWPYPATDSSVTRLSLPWS